VDDLAIAVRRPGANLNSVVTGLDGHVTAVGELKPLEQGRTGLKRHVDRAGVGSAAATLSKAKSPCSPRTPLGVESATSPTAEVGGFLLNFV
jgi:hypothetical protein